jgi:purine-nucleoside phosphorylase
MTPDDAPAQVQAAADALRQRVGDGARVGLILGTGLGRLADEVDARETVPYADVPHVPTPTVETHDGRFVAGTLRGVEVLAMQGRFHLYEGYSPWQVTLPVRVMAALGVEALLISNAAGGMDPLYRRGDLVLVTDHINLQGVNPLTGPNVEAWGPRFPDMSEPYDRGLREAAEAAALARGVPLRQGVYAAVIGPNLETRAEYRFLRTVGADVVGMSTVPEVIVARHAGVRVMAVSVVTDECFPDALEPVSIPDILAAAAGAEPDLTALLGDVVETLA